MSTEEVKYNSQASMEPESLATRQLAFNITVKWFGASEQLDCSASERAGHETTASSV